MGITDYERIGAAVGLNATEVERIDMAEDKSIRQLCLAGVPYGHYFTLEAHIRCPKCSGMITLAPCVACDAPSAWRPAMPENVAHQRGIAGRVLPDSVGSDSALGPRAAAFDRAPLKPRVHDATSSRAKDGPSASRNGFAPRASDISEPSREREGALRSFLLSRRRARGHSFACLALVRRAIAMSPTKTPDTGPETFVETSLKLSGKSEEEARTTGAMDRADEQLESFFETRYQTTASPIHRAVWDHDFPLELFQPGPPAKPTPACAALHGRVAVDRPAAHRGRHALERKRQVASPRLCRARRGGLLGPARREGIRRTRGAHVGLHAFSYAHGDRLSDPGRTRQRARLRRRRRPLARHGHSRPEAALPDAAGQRRAHLGLCPDRAGRGFGYDRAENAAVLDGDDYVVNGEKLFITNAIPGRIVALVCLIDNRPEVLLVDLPEENEHFQLIRYGLYALKHAYNNGLKFKDFRVPKQNLLKPKFGNGLTVAYHGLNRGRVAVCANASGGLRTMLASILPWARYRLTYGEAIDRRELVQRRVGRLAGMIVASDALVEWCSWLLDEGYRGEMAKWNARSPRYSAAKHRKKPPSNS